VGRMPDRMRDPESNWWLNEGSSRGDIKRVGYHG
jgi:hypothetical protein